MFRSRALPARSPVLLLPLLPLPPIPRVPAFRLLVAFLLFSPPPLCSLASKLARFVQLRHTCDEHRARSKEMSRGEVLYRAATTVLSTLWLLQG